MVQMSIGGSRSKSRSGCITCKIRRVKCDETKPTCLRCRHAHRECGGYVHAERRKPVRDVQRLLAPKALTSSTASFPLMSQPSHHLFTSDEEFRYFKVFCDDSASNLGEYLDENLWTYIVLQASEQETFIKHAVIALGALNKALDATTAMTATAATGGGLFGRELANSHLHYQAAFKQYGKSIQGILKACQEERRSKRTILIACLLAICFEYFYGKVDLAIAHVKNGLKLLDEWFWTMRDMAKFDERNLFEGIIEDELISIYTRIDTDVSAWHEVRPFTMHPDLQKTAMHIAQNLPSRGFETLSLARRHFDIMLKQVDDFVLSVDDPLWVSTNEPIVSKPSSQPIDPFWGILPSSNQQDDMDMFKQCLLRWHRTFQPLFTQSLAKGGNDALVAKALSLRFICSSIALHCCFGLELSYDAYESEFRAALLLAKALSAAPLSYPRPTFIISSILIRSLFFIALKCRADILRAEAVAYLQSMVRREGIWDSQMAAAVANVIIVLEGGIGTGFVPEHKRLRAIKTSFDLHEREAKLKYLAKENCSEGAGYVVHQVEVSW